MVKGDVEARIAELRTAVEEARSMPMSSSVMVNRAELLDLVRGLEEAVTKTVAGATGVMAEWTDVVSRGREEADAIIRAAQAERDKLVSDTDVFRLAESQADELRTSAERESTELRRETDAYVEEKLANFELTLERTLDVVRKGRARLTGGHAHGLADDSDVGAIDLPRHLER